MITIITDIKGNEPDILTAFKHEDLVLKVRGEREVFRANAPGYGWTTEQLEQVCEEYCKIISWTQFDALEAYVGNQWVGSTEV